LILAAIYPVLVWFLVYRLRRRWSGFALAILAGTLVWVLAPTLGRLIPRGSELIGALIYAEAVLVTLIGLWIATLRRPPAVDHYCSHCHYDLDGLILGPGARCPECGEGVPTREPPKALERCTTCGLMLAGVDLASRKGRCPTCATVLPIGGSARPSPSVAGR
jgi:DNA-directed RNA polymerase subunit RPC12/RpoP